MTEKELEIEQDKNKYISEKLHECVMELQLVYSGLYHIIGDENDVTQALFLMKKISKALASLERVIVSLEID